MYGMAYRVNSLTKQHEKQRNYALKEEIER